ncbi:MAG: hypothetical protein M0R46_11900 [Candidatus Muirbacterium halophilum]|nr:hypothetical protein [Candidatus Muirbacterium halophilum]MCK9476618.1 hypothetical protein [Candidatus Muirbacterium halophilum]
MKILFIRLDHIGDCFLTLPAIREFKKAYPEFLVDILCKDNTKEIFRLSGLFNKIYTINLPYTCNSYEKKNSIYSLIKKTLKLNSSKFDVIYNFRPNLKDKIFLKLIHGKDITDYKQKLYKDIMHIIDRNLLNLKNQFPKINIDNNYYVKIEISENTNLNQKYNIENSILFHIGGSYMKKFSDEKILELYKLISSDFDNVLIVKSKYDKFKYTEQVRLLEVDNVGEWGSLCENSQTIIGFDTGPMHIAAAHAKNIFSIWGPTSIDYFGLKGKNVINYKISGYKKDFIPGEKFSFEKYDDYLQKVNIEKIYKDFIDLCL